MLTAVLVMGAIFVGAPVMIIAVLAIWLEVQRAKGNNPFE